MIVKRLIASLMLVVCTLAFSMPPGVDAMPGLEKYFVSTFSSQDVGWIWSGRYTADYQVLAKHWSDFPEFVKQARKLSGNKILIIDLDFHGSTGGLYISTLEDSRGRSIAGEDATMGYIVKCLEENLGKKETIILCESCFAGNAYRNTIRGNLNPFHEPYRDNFDQVPSRPIWGTGSGFVNYGITMILEMKHNVRIWWEDLRDYENKVPYPPELEIYDLPGESRPVSKTTKDIALFNNFIFYFLP